MTSKSELEIEKENLRVAELTIKALLADSNFTEFDPVQWTANKTAVSAYASAEKAFPVLTQYSHGTELQKLAKGYRWLADIHVPSKRHVSAHILQGDPAQNLVTLAIYIKLQFLKIHGSALTRCEPFWCLCQEMFKIMGLERSAQASEWKFHLEHVKRTSDLLIQGVGLRSLKQDLGEGWQQFREYLDGHPHPVATAVEFETKPWYVETMWVSDSRRRDDDTLWRQAMSRLLKNSTSTDAYGAYVWREAKVIECWDQIKKNYESLDDIVPQELYRKWRALTSNNINDSPDHRNQWLGFSDDFWHFCLAAGCLKADRTDPFTSLDALRDLVSSQFAYTTDLHNRIDKLNKQIILQQRMITALAYRNFIENLSVTSTGSNPGDKWRTFVETIFREAGKSDRKISPDHPFIKLYDRHALDKKNGIMLLEQMAKRLFGDLSRTIHHFQLQPFEEFDPYIPITGQFDPVQIDFLVSMKPTKHKKSHSAEPLWDEERTQYLRQSQPAIDSKVATTPEDQTNRPASPDAGTGKGKSKKQKKVKK